MRRGLRVVVFPETGGRRWTARCLEHDITAHGLTMDAAVDTLLRIATAHAEFDKRHNREPLSAFGKAPGSFWLAFDRGTRLPGVPTIALADGSELPPVIAAQVDSHPCMRRFPTTLTA